MAFLNLKDINYFEESKLEDIYSKSITTESYFNTSLVTISKLNKEYRESLAEFYSKALNESVSESLSSLYKEFISNVTSIIGKFNKCIRDNHSNYISSLKRKMVSDRKITLDKDKITDVRAGNIYNFTFYDDIPKSIGKDIYYEEINKLQKILKNDSIEQDQKNINLLFIYNELLEDLRGPFYDRFRGQILGLNYDISASEFVDTLFAIYRNGGKKINTIIEKDEILEIEKRFKNAKQYITSVEIQKDSIIKEYDIIKRELSNIKLTDVASNIGSNAEMLDERLQKYIKAKTEQILNMCSIHTLAYTAKLDAVAALYMQDKSILTAVINKYSSSEEYEEI